MSEIEKMLAHVLNCFAPCDALVREQSSPVRGEISVATFNKARALLKEAEEIRGIRERSAREQELAVRAYYED